MGSAPGTWGGVLLLKFSTPPSCVRLVMAAAGGDNFRRVGRSDMPLVVIYTTVWCPYCILRAKQLLQRAGVDQEIACDGKFALNRARAGHAAGSTTVPVGSGSARPGCDDLHATGALQADRAAVCLKPSGDN